MGRGGADGGVVLRLWWSRWKIWEKLGKLKVMEKSNNPGWLGKWLLS